VTPVAHHLGEDSLTGLLIVSGGMVPVLATIGRAKVTEAFNRLRQLVDHGGRMTDR
jgi:hypothetical protein